MADCKKYNGSTCGHSLRKLGTSTDTLTTLPADLYADGTNATISLDGNMSQSDTPTPQNPIMPQGTGERTGNLYFKKLAGANISDGGAVTTLTGFDLYFAEVEQGVRYSGTGYIYAFFEDVPAIGSISYNGSRVVESFVNIVSPINGYVAVRTSNTAQNVMCNTGSTILPHEPYGYKIPISSANTTTPVYLGEVETTRKIKKLVLTGEESVSVTATGIAVIVLSVPPVVGAECVCSHYIGTNVTTYSALGVGECTTSIVASGGGNRLAINDVSLSTADEYKAYFAQQYAAGTPVTVWYVLATEETGIVNEPLMKIGDYADEVSGITIPVTAGGDSVDIETTVKPSEVSLAYTGWHDAQCKEYDGSQWV